MSLIPLFVLLAACVFGVMGWVDRSVNANNIMFIVVFVAISFFSLQNYAYYLCATIIICYERCCSLAIV